MKIDVSRTFTFDEKSIRDLLVQYLAESEGVDVKPEAFNVIVQESQDGFGYNEFVPPKLTSISVTVKEDT